MYQNRNGTGIFKENNMNIYQFLTESKQNLFFSFEIAFPCGINWNSLQICTFTVK